MTSVDFLPREEPGAPLYRLPPGFIDDLMVEIRGMERRRKSRRVSAILAAGFCAVGLTCLTVWSYSPAVHYEIPVARMNPRPVVPTVTVEEAQETAQQSASDQTIVHRCSDFQQAGLNGGTSVPPCAATAFYRPGLKRLPAREPPGKP